MNPPLDSGKLSDEAFAEAYGQLTDLISSFETAMQDKYLISWQTDAIQDTIDNKIPVSNCGNLRELRKLTEKEIKTNSGQISVLLRLAVTASIAHSTIKNAVENSSMFLKRSGKKINNAIAELDIQYY